MITTVQGGKTQSTLGKKLGHPEIQILLACESARFHYSCNLFYSLTIHGNRMYYFCTHF